MSSCLFECLKEAGLERYYSTLQRRGYDTAFSLLYLPPAELQDVGISTDSDRQRFLQLVQIIASFHQGGELSPRRVVSPQQSPVKNKSSIEKLTTKSRSQMTRSRRLGYPTTDSSSSESLSEESPPGYVLSPRRKPRTQFKDTPTSRPVVTKKLEMPIPVPVLPTKHVHRTKVQELTPSGHDSSEGDESDPITPSLPSAEASDDVTYATRNIRRSAESLRVQRVMRTKGYNYGLPRDGHKQNGAIGLTPKMQRKVVARSVTPGADSARGSPKSPQARRRITVCVRKRPILEAETQTGEFDVVTCNHEDGGKDGGLVVHELKHTVDMAEFIQQNVFQFDKVFAEHTTNQEMYEKAVKPMVDWIMTHTNRATCFGYGQTGAGKTHTLLGDESEWGVFFHAAKDVLSRLSSQHARTSRGKRGFTLSVSLYEIYCSRIFDLLNDHKKLQALEDSNKQIHIQGLKSVTVKDMATLQEVVRQGLAERSVGITGANQDSSRSHAIVQLAVKDAGGAEYSRLSFIDLAGSERACDALQDSDKQNRLEGAEINQSLLALKECIRSLDRALAHTPFRQSKLTQVLRDSFLGNSKTCMIANISPSHSSLEHTMNTLRYASRVKELHRKPGYSTPRQQRLRTPVGSSRSAQRRPFTADPTYSQSRPGIFATPSSKSQLSRSVSIESSMRVMDYSAAFKSQGRELARTPPPSMSHITMEEVLSQPTPEDSNMPVPTNCGSTPVQSQGTSRTSREYRSLPVHKKQSIFTPEAVGASSTPQKRRQSAESNKKSTNVLKEISANDTAATSSSTPASTPRFLNDTELVGGLSILPPKDSSHASYPAKSTIEVMSSAQTLGSSSGKDRSTGSSSNSSSIAAEQGSSKDSRNVSASTAHRSSTNSSTSSKQNSRHGSVSEEVEANCPSQNNEHSRDKEQVENKFVSSRRSSRASVTSNDSENNFEDATQNMELPESTKNPGLPSPKKFLTYLKDKHSIKTKALKQQLRKARRRAKHDSQASDEDGASSDHSTSSANTLSCSTSRIYLTSNVQQHHQQLSMQSETGTQPAPITITNAPTPPRLPSPKLDRSEPRRSSRVSSRSSSPGGRMTPDERKSPNSTELTPPTMTGLTSASELRARLAAAIGGNFHSDNDEPKPSASDVLLPSTSENQAITDASRNLSSSSDKENKLVGTKKDEYVHRAQNEVIIAHQEHISEILSISIEEERLYHELRDQWGKGKHFDAYTKSLRKLLARKTQSIEALKIQLALYDRVRNAPD